jgi:hypothetical protein
MLAIFDIDGTLAHMDDRRTPFEWDKVHLDRLDTVIARFVRMHYYVQDTILMVSGRDGVCYEATRNWLDHHELHRNELFMRKAGDFRDDTIIKKEIWENRIVPAYSPDPASTIIYDDRDKVVAMWRSLGLKVFQVAPGNF